MSDPVAALPLGARVVVRARLSPQRVADLGGPSMTDAVGTLVAVDATSLVVETSRGRVTIQRDRVVAAKVVPPRPARRGAPHLALSIESLQRVMVDGWPPLERERLGDWLLRAGGGFTRRANSVMTSGDPGVPVGAALEHVERWYAARGLPPLASLAGPQGFRTTDDGVGAELVARGYLPQVRTLVMTAASSTLADASATARHQVTLSDILEPAWLAAYARQREPVPGVTERVLSGSPAQVFACVPASDGSVAAIARLSIAHAWGGLSCLWVDPAHRRRGLAEALTAALGAEASGRGIRSIWLQVEEENTAALALYRGMGFRTHHAYEYLVRS